MWQRLRTRRKSYRNININCCLLNWISLIPGSYNSYIVSYCDLSVNNSNHGVKQKQLKARRKKYKQKRNEAGREIKRIKQWSFGSGKKCLDDELNRTHRHTHRDVVELKLRR